MKCMTHFAGMMVTLWRGGGCDMDIDMMAKVGAFVSPSMSTVADFWSHEAAGQKDNYEQHRDRAKATSSA